MSSLRKMKRKETVPKLNKAKKYTKELLTRENVAKAALNTRKNKIYKHCVAVVNTCVFMVLRDVFGYSAHKCCVLCGRMGNISECIRLGLVHPFDILSTIQDEVCWEYPRRKVNEVNLSDLSAGGMTDGLVSQEKERAYEQMEIMWLEALHLQEGFSKVRLVRFLHSLRAKIKTYTLDKARAVNDWLASRGIEFVGFNELIEMEI